MNQSKFPVHKYAHSNRESDVREGGEGEGRGGGVGGGGARQLSARAASGKGGERRQRWGGGEEKGGGEKQAFNLEKCLKTTPKKKWLKQVDLVSKINNKM